MNIISPNTDMVCNPQIEIILDSLNQSDIQYCFSLLLVVIKKKDEYRGADDLILRLKDQTTTYAQKSIVLFIYKAWREAGSTSYAENINSVKKLLWLRSRLYALSSTLEDSTETYFNAEPSVKLHEKFEGESKDLLHDGIIHVYQACLGRFPLQDEITIWKCKLTENTLFILFLCETYDSPEAVKHRASIISFAADFTFRNDDPLLLGNALIRRGIIGCYQLWLGRTPSHSEIDYWHGEIKQGLEFIAFLCTTVTCPEAAEYREKDVSRISDGRFIQILYESILGRGCSTAEIADWEDKFAGGGVDRAYLLRTLLYSAAMEAETRALSSNIDSMVYIMGTDGQFITLDTWNSRKQLLSDIEFTEKSMPCNSRFYIHRQPTMLVSAICSLYKGGKYIDQFMENIISQTCFNDFCELIIIDADSPNNESEVIERYCRLHKNIVYKRINYRIGIYDAWNVAAKIARGVYLTNTNLDDLRRDDSFELQACVLDNLPFVDVVYQDFYYTFDPFINFAEIAGFGFKSDLPIVTEQNMMSFNSPHNAPMWRKRLHDDLGYFDINYRSAGDYEFWMRCLAAGKVFYKLNDPHVAYYQNPEGVSTRHNTMGFEETKRIRKKYARQLVSENIVMPFDTFIKNVSLNPVVHEWSHERRYASVQDALHAAAIRTKYVHSPGER